MRWGVYKMIHQGRRGRKPGYIHEMGSHDLKSCEVKCQRNI
jgi:NAD-dependent dihydropyrimidine dehydrogenase PreA subunit